MVERQTVTMLGCGAYHVLALTAARKARSSTSHARTTRGPHSPSTHAHKFATLAHTHAYSPCPHQCPKIRSLCPRGAPHPQAHSLMPPATWAGVRVGPQRRRAARHRPCLPLGEPPPGEAQRGQAAVLRGGRGRQALLGRHPGIAKTHQNTPYTCKDTLDINLTNNDAFHSAIKTIFPVFCVLHLLFLKIPHKILFLLQFSFFSLSLFTFALTKCLSLTQSESLRPFPAACDAGDPRRRAAGVPHRVRVGLPRERAPRRRARLEDQRAAGGEPPLPSNSLCPSLPLCSFSFCYPA